MIKPFQEVSIMDFHKANRKKDNKRFRRKSSEEWGY